METITSHEEKAAALAAGFINEVLAADAVWCFGVRLRSEGCAGTFFREVKKCESVHLYLLVFAGEAVPGCEGELADAVFKRSEGSVTATVLVYQSSKLARVKGNHRSFLGEVLASGTLVFRKEEYCVPDFGGIVPDESAKMEYWKHCRYMAICCLEAENAMENPNSEPVQAVLHHQAVEQVCLGLIYMFLGCRPNYFGLGYLLELCELFLPEAADLFPRQSAEEKARFAVLELRMESLRYRIKHPSITNIEVLRSRVNAFLKIAEVSVEKYLDAAKGQEASLC